MIKIRAGEYRHIVDIESCEETQDSFGQAHKTWTLEDTRTAAIFPLSGKELEVAKQLRAEVSHQIKLRFYPDLTTEHRIKAKGRTFEIVSVLNTEERDRETIVIAWEQV